MRWLSLGEYLTSAEIKSKIAACAEAFHFGGSTFGGLELECLQRELVSAQAAILVVNFHRNEVK